VIAAPEQRAVDVDLARAVLVHLDRQIASARRLYASILAQGKAIRGRDVEAVVERLADVKTEMSLRSTLEEERTDLLVRAGIALGVPAPNVTLEAMTTLMPPAEAVHARERSAELRGLLGEQPESGYGPSGSGDKPPTHRVVDAQA
jgi:hypothetical protein